MIEILHKKDISNNKQKMKLINLSQIYSSCRNFKFNKRINYVASCKQFQCVLFWFLIKSSISSRLKTLKMNHIT